MKSLRQHEIKPSAWLTSVEVMDRIRSRSSTSCLKVGLWDGMACQHSLMIMYLKGQRSKPAPTPLLCSQSIQVTQNANIQWSGLNGSSARVWPSSVQTLTAHVCSWQVCPSGVLLSTAWRVPPLGSLGMATLPGWRSPITKPRKTTWSKTHKQKQNTDQIRGCLSDY